MNKPDDRTLAFDAAEEFYFGHLYKMLKQAGQEAAGPHLHEHLRLWKESEEKEGPNTVLKLKLTQKLTGYHITVNAVTGETISWYIDFLSSEGDQSMSSEEATQLAQQVAKPPENAILREAGYDTAGGRVFFRASWMHVHNGLPVEGDVIEVLINGKARRAFSYTKVWRDPDLSGRLVER